jgi:hypothetical protein
MGNAGIFVLASLQIAAPKSGALLTPIVDLDGMSAVTLDADFKYGSGGARCSTIVSCRKFSSDKVESNR